MKPDYCDSMMDLEFEDRTLTLTGHKKLPGSVEFVKKVARAFASLQLDRRNREHPDEVQGAARGHEQVQRALRADAGRHDAEGGVASCDAQSHEDGEVADHPEPDEEQPQEQLHHALYAGAAEIGTSHHAL